MLIINECIIKMNDVDVKDVLRQNMVNIAKKMMLTILNIYKDAIGGLSEFLPDNQVLIKINGGSLIIDSSGNQCISLVNDDGITAFIVYSYSRFENVNDNVLTFGMLIDVLRLAKYSEKTFDTLQACTIASIEY